MGKPDLLPIHPYRPGSICVHIYLITRSCNILHIHAIQVYYYTLLWMTDCMVALADPPDRNTPPVEKMVEFYRTEAHHLNVVFSETYSLQLSRGCQLFAAQYHRQSDLQRDCVFFSQL